MPFDCSLSKKFDQLSVMRSSVSYKLTMPPFDPLYTPFSNEEVSKILLVRENSIPTLKNMGLLQATCFEHELMRVSNSYCCYWDMLTSTAAMSLYSVGFSLNDAITISFDLVDEIAGILEDTEDENFLDENSASEIVQEVIGAFESKYMPPESSYTLTSVSTKVAVDVLSMNVRCIDLLSSNSDKLLPSMVKGQIFLCSKQRLDQ